MHVAKQHYIDECQTLAGKLPGRRLDWLQARRGAALARFKEVGLPSQRDEDWRYTTIKPITSKAFRAPQKENHAEEEHAETSQLESLQIAGLESCRLVFIDGLFAPQLSARDSAGAGVIVESLAHVLEHRPELIAQTFGTLTPRDPHGFTALNNACSRDGVVVHLAPNAHASVPVEMLFISCAEDGFSQPRNLFIAGAASKAALIERHVSLNGHNTFTNSTSEIVLGERAEIDYHLVQTQSAAACHVCGVWARQARGSRFSCRTATFGGALVRNDLGVELAGEHAHCDMLGLYGISGRQHVDNHTTVTHAAENCCSRELYKGILDQRSRAVFHGRIVVRPGAQKTDAAQANNNLLLSRGAEIDCKPQLEIYADDVKCAHGATVGQLDADALFYLRSRGIGEVRARALLTFAFANDVIGEVEISELKNALEGLLARCLTGDDPANGGVTEAGTANNSMTTGQLP